MLSAGNALHDCRLLCHPRGLPSLRRRPPATVHPIFPPPRFVSPPDSFVQPQPFKNMQRLMLLASRYRHATNRRWNSGIVTAREEHCSKRFEAVKLLRFRVAGKWQMTIGVPCNRTVLDFSTAYDPEKKLSIFSERSLV